MRYVVRAFTAAVAGAISAYAGCLAFVMWAGSIPDEDDAWRGHFHGLVSSVLPVVALMVFLLLLVAGYVAFKPRPIGVRHLVRSIAIAVATLALIAVIFFLESSDAISVRNALLLAAFSTTVMSLALVVAPSIVWWLILFRAPSNNSLDGARGGQ